AVVGATGIARGATWGICCAETLNMFTKIVVRTKAGEYRRIPKRVRNFRSGFALGFRNARSAAPLSVLSANWKCSFFIGRRFFIRSVAAAFARRNTAANQ